MRLPTFLASIIKVREFNLSFFRQPHCHAKFLFRSYIIPLLHCTVLLFLLIGCGHPTKSQNEKPDETGLSFGTDSTFEVITWNLEYFPKSSETVNRVAEIIFLLNPDVLGFQEITSRSALMLVVDRLNSFAGSETWIGYRAGSTGSTGQQLAYIINTENVSVLQSPFEIYEDEGRAFPRKPYVLRVVVNGQEVVIINNHLKCCGNGEIEEDSWDEETRRQEASLKLQTYIEESWTETQVIIIGDYNDEIDEPASDNVFWNFISQPNQFKFTDMNIANGHSSDYSYPTWPSHIDHILITNELFDEFESANSEVRTIRVDDFLEGGWEEYETNISDHRPVGWKY